MSFTAEQVRQLLMPIAPSRVLRDNKGMAHVAQHDVRAHLIRIFGFEGWDQEIVDLRCVRDVVVTIPATAAKNGQPGNPERKVPGVTYLCRLRLTVRDPQGRTVKVSEDVGTGTSPNLPNYGDAHDFASKNAVSYALKRAATSLGDGFGLSLYSKGQTSALVSPNGRLPLAYVPDGEHTDVQAGVPRQVDLGDEAPEPAPERRQRPARDEEVHQEWVATFNEQVVTADPSDLRELRGEVTGRVQSGLLTPEEGLELHQVLWEAEKALGGGR